MTNSTQKSRASQSPGRLAFTVGGLILAAFFVAWWIADRLNLSRPLLTGWVYPGAVREEGSDKARLAYGRFSTADDFDSVDRYYSKKFRVRGGGDPTFIGEAFGRFPGLGSKSSLIAGITFGARAHVQSKVFLQQTKGGVVAACVSRAASDRATSTVLAGMAFAPGPVQTNALSLQSFEYPGSMRGSGGHAGNPAGRLTSHRYTTPDPLEMVWGFYLNQFGAAPDAGARAIASGTPPVKGAVDDGEGLVILPTAKRRDLEERILVRFTGRSMILVHVSRHKDEDHTHYILSLAAK